MDLDLDLDHPAEEDTMTIDDDHQHSPRQDQDGDAVMDTEIDGLASEEVDFAEDDELELEYEHEDEIDDMDAEDTPPVKEHLVSPFGLSGELEEVNPFIRSDRPSFHATHETLPAEVQAEPPTAPLEPMSSFQNERQQTQSSDQHVDLESAGQDSLQGEEHYDEYEDHDHFQGDGEDQGEEEETEEAEDENGDRGGYEAYEHEADEEQGGQLGEPAGETGKGGDKEGDLEVSTAVLGATLVVDDYKAVGEVPPETDKQEEAHTISGQPETATDVPKDPSVQPSSESASVSTLTSLPLPPDPASTSTNPLATSTLFEIDATPEEHDQEFTLEIDEGEDEDMDDYPTDVHSMPAIILHLPNLGARSLFLPLPDESKLPVWLQGRLEQLGESSLGDVWSAIKEEMAKEKLTRSGEMIITEKQMELKMGEDDLNLQSVTLLEFAQVHYGCGLPSPIQLYISFEPHRFITRFNAIQQEVQAQLHEESENANVDVDEEHDGHEVESNVDISEDKDGLADSHDDRERKREEYLRQKRARGGDAPAEHGSTRPRPAPIESDHPNADWANARPIAPMHINGTRLFASRQSQEPEVISVAHSTETEPVTTASAVAHERRAELVTVPPPLGRQELQEPERRGDDDVEGGKEKPGDDKDTIESTDTNMTEEEYFKRRVDMQLPGDKDGILVPDDEIALLHKGAKSTNVETPADDMTIEPTEDTLATPLDSTAVSAVPEETLGEKSITEDPTTLHEKTTSVDTEYSKDENGFDDEGIDVSLDAADPLADSMQLAAEKAEQAQILADESAAISGEIADKEEAFIDEGYSDPDADAKVEHVQDKEDAFLAQAHDEVVQAELKAASDQSVENIDAIADQAVADSLIESPDISPAATTLGDDELVSAGISETPISATDQPSLDETSTKDTLTYLDDDGDVIPESLLSPRAKRKLEYEQEYAAVLGVPVEEVDTDSKRSRTEW